MMEFIKEITEAKLIKTQNDLNISFSAVCDNLYLLILTLEFLSRLKQGKELAEKYAKSTSSYINYTEFRTSATDLYNLLYFVQQPLDNVEKIFKSSDARRLRAISTIPRMELNRWLMNLEKNHKDNYFLMRLEKSLNIANGDLKDIRRILHSTNPSQTDLDIVSTKILNFIRFKMPLVDIRAEIEPMLSSRKYTYIK